MEKDEQSSRNIVSLSVIKESSMGKQISVYPPSYSMVAAVPCISNPRREAYRTAMSRKIMPPSREKFVLKRDQPYSNFEEICVVAVR